MLHRQASAPPAALLILSAAIAVCGCTDESDEAFRTVSEADVTPSREEVTPTGLPRPTETPGELEGTAEPETRDSEVVATDGDVHGSPEDLLADVPAHPIRVLIPQRQFAPEGPRDALRVSFDDFDLEEILGVTIPEPGVTHHFPDWLNGLDGRRIRVRGFMVPPFREEGLKKFTLARDTEVCCFGPQGKIYHVVDVWLREGHTTDHIYLRPFDVEGTFRIEPIADGGELLLLYEMTDAVILGE